MYTIDVMKPVFYIIILIMIFIGVCDWWVLVLEKKIKAWHWSNKEGTLGYGNGRQIVQGETLSVEGKPVKCSYGLHGSVSILDALGYASGCHLWRVEIWGEVDAEEDKLCGKNRKALVDYGDVMPLVVEFAKWCADRAKQHAAKYADKERKLQEKRWDDKLAELKG